MAGALVVTRSLPFRIRVGLAQRETHVRFSARSARGEMVRSLCRLIGFVGSSDMRACRMAINAVLRAFIIRRWRRRRRSTFWFHAQHKWVDLMAGEVPLGSMRVLSLRYVFIVCINGLAVQDM